MKKIPRQASIKKAMLFLFVLAIHLITFAQENTGGVPIAPGEDQDNAWFNETWFWLAGAAISVLVIVSLVKRANNKNSIK